MCYFLIDLAEYKAFSLSLQCKHLILKIMIIGRKKELSQLREAYESEYSEFVAVYGRRRVGKTFLVREAFDYNFTFQHSGLAK